MKIKVNGREHEVDSDPDTPLLYVLRNDLALNGAKFGCGLGQCGACTVMDPGPLQRAFIEEQAAQCGYCIAGMMMRAAALLQKNPHPSDAEIRAALESNLCRCGTHMRILRAVRRAAELMRIAALGTARRAP